MNFNQKIIQSQLVTSNTLFLYSKQDWILDIGMEKTSHRSCWSKGYISALAHYHVYESDFPLPYLHVLILSQGLRNINNVTTMTNVGPLGFAQSQNGPHIGPMYLTAVTRIPFY